MLEIRVTGLYGKDMFRTSTMPSPSKPTERFLMPRSLFMGAISNFKSNTPKRIQHERKLIQCYISISL